MKPTSIVFVFSLLLFANFSKADVPDTQLPSIQKLEQFQGNNHFSYINSSTTSLQQQIQKTILIKL